MGEIRASGAKALIGIAVNEDFLTDTDVQSLLVQLQDYYADDTAFLGISLVVYEDYLEYSTVPEIPAESESKGIPGFTGLVAVACLLAVSFRQKKR
jgi:hypothetical protein